MIDNRIIVKAEWIDEFNPYRYLRRLPYLWLFLLIITMPLYFINVEKWILLIWSNIIEIWHIIITILFCLPPFLLYLFMMMFFPSGKYNDIIYENGITSINFSLFEIYFYRVKLIDFNNIKECILLTKEDDEGIQCILSNKKIKPKPFWRSWYKNNFYDVLKETLTEKGFLPQS